VSPASTTARMTRATGATMIWTLLLSKSVIVVSLFQERQWSAGPAPVCSPTPEYKASADHHEPDSHAASVADAPHGEVLRRIGLLPTIRASEASWRLAEYVLDPIQAVVQIERACFGRLQSLERVRFQLIVYVA